MWLIVLFILSIFLYFMVWIVDSSFLHIKQKEGIITYKEIIPAHTTTTFTHVGKVTIPQTHYNPTAYEIEIAIDNLSNVFEVSYEDYNNIDINQKVYCEYTNGRILHSLYIKTYTIK